MNFSIASFHLSLKASELIRRSHIKIHIDKEKYIAHRTNISSTTLTNT
jgi:hypothetical protein